MKRTPEEQSRFDEGRATAKTDKKITGGYRHLLPITHGLGHAFVDGYNSYIDDTHGY